MGRGEIHKEGESADVGIDPKAARKPEIIGLKLAVLKRKVREKGSTRP